jgi:hypothetical protein
LAFLPDYAGDAGEDCEKVEGRSLFERYSVDVPGSFHFAGYAVVEFLDCHGSVDFVLVEISSAEGEVERMETYSQDHCPLD